MPKGRRHVLKRGKGQKKAVAYASGDVSLNDYANAASCSSSTLRVKKGSVNAIHAEARLLAKPEGKQLKEELTWFERDIDDFDIDSDKGDNCEEDGADRRLAKLRGKRQKEELLWFERDIDDFDIDYNKGENKRGPTHCHRKKRVTRKKHKKGRTYPIDLWYILSEYIYPEDVGRFAALCHGTYHVVGSCAFWRQLYLRYYTKKIKLPVEIKPESIERIRGLRARVVRSLFYLYSPLAARSVSMVRFENEPHSMQGQRCVLAWHQPVKNTWRFCFKFIESHNPTFRPGPVVESSEHDMLPGYSDLFYNPEEGCRIMEIRCQDFAAVPMVMGMVLNHVYLTVSARMRHHRLRLLFDSVLQDGNSSSAERIVDLDQVVNIRIIPWWDTKYPFTF